MIRRKLNKKKGFKGFKVIIDTSILKELEAYNNLSIDHLFDNKNKERNWKRPINFIKMYNTYNYKIYIFMLPFCCHFYFLYNKNMMIIN